MNTPQTLPTSSNAPTAEKAKPWKTIGYRGFSNFLASDNDFLLFRKFGALNARLLLYLQDEIVQLETTLNALEQHHSRKEADDIHNGSFREDALPHRTQLLSVINIKMRQYNELLLQHSQLCAKPAVPPNHIRSVSNWFSHTQNAIHDEERAYITHPTDLIQLVPSSYTPIRSLLERSTRFRLFGLWRKPTPTSLHGHFPQPDLLHYTSDSRVDAFVAATVTFLGMVMLIVPLWVLAVTHGTMKRLGVITGFVVLFLGLVAFTTVARPFESLAAAAAYSAVLVVFLQIAD
ncbi:hypothetical protein CC80DRAFT_485693 [Byssothecium circinans]|uniref:DUF6594 domain-containing protein n=1 Tax=Byssothecium circinans TaxID=147558 RepID=A0A6A5TAH8_9PLEO|nr:hypothetical protein CC80DRAFT_485693 [Byssothecium circinans]